MHEEKLARASRYLIYIILAVLPLERIPSLELSHPIQITVRLSQVAGVVLILLNLPKLWRSRGALSRDPWRWLVAFWGVCAVSAGLAADLKRAVAVLAFTVFVGLLAWVLAARFERDKVAVYFNIVVVSALVTCAFGFYQFFGDLLGIPAAWTGLRDVYTKEVFGFPRIQSTGLEPLYFGDFLLVPAGMLVVAIANGWRRFAALALVPIATVVWLTVSRGAMVALAVMIAVGLGVTAVRRRWANAVPLLGATLVSVGLAYGLLYLGTHVLTQPQTDQAAHAIENFSKQTTNISNGESSEGRAVTRRLAFKAFLAHPVAGIGPGNFGGYAAREMPDRFSGTRAIVNNEPLEILAETGILGLGTLLAFVGTLLWRMVRAAKSRPAELALGYGLALALVGIALQYQTFSTLYITHIWVAIGLLAGLALTVARGRAKA
jgi:O-antigen ligase